MTAVDRRPVLSTAFSTIVMNMPNQRILLVEDDAQTRPLLTHVLVSEGYAVDAADSMATSWAFLRAHQCGLVIADWRLPDGDGLEIADAAARAGSETVILSC